MRRRLYVDPAAWYDDADSTPLLADVADAVWQHQRLEVMYRRWRAPQDVERTIEPYGLVLKGGRWYVVAGCDGQLRTYRVSQLRRAIPTGQFDRPPDFDLAAYWHAYLADFAERRHQEFATVRLSARALPRMAHHLEPAVVRAVETSAGPPDADGWFEATLPIESIDHAHEELLRYGAEVEVLAPAPLRALLARTAADLARRYAG